MVDLRPDQLEIVKAVLKAEVPKAEVWAFGSRAKWTARDTSDLDLVLVGERALPYRTIARLRRAFEESYLPFSVDVVDWHGVSEDFRTIILAQKVVIQAGSSDGSGQLEERRWRSVPLAECANFLSGGTPPKGVPDYWNGDIPWVSAKDMKIFRLFDTLEHVTPEGVSNGTRLVPAGTVLVLVRGMTLHSDVPICITRRPMAFNQDVRALRPRPEVDSDYLAYALLANKPALLSMVDSASHGTGRIHSGALASFPMALPSLSEQRAIASILGALDDKIDLNRRMNETLEAMARAIFKSWFVGFEETPGDWREGSVEDLVSLSRDLLDPAAFPEEEFDHYSIPAFDSGQSPIKEQGNQIKSTKFVLPQGAVLLSKLNPRIPRVWRPSLSGERCSIGSTEFLVATPKAQDFDREYIYSLFCSDSFIEAFASRTTGTSGSHQRVRPDDLLSIRCIVPDLTLRRLYSERVKPLFDKVALNREESRTLAALRDTLLPKLLSGEIRVKQAEKMVGEAV